MSLSVAPGQIIIIIKAFNKSAFLVEDVGLPHLEALEAHRGDRLEHQRRSICSRVS